MANRAFDPVLGYLTELPGFFFDRGCLPLPAGTRPRGLGGHFTNTPPAPTGTGHRCRRPGHPPKDAFRREQRAHRSSAEPRPSRHGATSPLRRLPAIGLQEISSRSSAVSKIVAAVPELSIGGDAATLGPSHGHPQLLRVGRIAPHSPGLGARPQALRADHGPGAAGFRGVYPLAVLDWRALPNVRRPRDHVVTGAAGPGVHHTSREPAGLSRDVRGADPALHTSR